MINEEKAHDLSVYLMSEHLREKNCINQRKLIEKALLEMAEWKDEQLPKWHRIVEGDFPKIPDDYLTVCQHKNKKDGILLYEITYYTGEEWENRTHWENIIAWQEIPKF